MQRLKMVTVSRTIKGVGREAVARFLVCRSDEDVVAGWLGSTLTLRERILSCCLGAAVPAPIARIPNEVGLFAANCADDGPQERSDR